MDQVSTFVGHAERVAPDFVRDHFPRLAEFAIFGVAVWQWIAMGIALAVSVGIGFAISRAFNAIARRTLKRPQAAWFLALSDASKNPMACLMALGLLDSSIHWIDLSGRVSRIADTVAFQLLIAGLAWLAIAGSGSLTQSVDQRLTGRGEFETRGARTQLVVAHRVISTFVTVAAAALILSGFHAVRSVGVSLLASAGIAGIVIGIAAQKPLSSLLAGLQLSIAQPIRIGDSVVVENEMGTVEEIYLTFVIVRCLDERRLVVPVSKFLDQSFQNWTRVRTNLIGTVELWLDYATPLQALRDELKRICEASPQWDKQTCAIQVADLKDKSMQLKLLVSAATPGALLELRNEVREKLVPFLVRLNQPAGAAAAPLPPNPPAQLRANGHG